MSVPALSTGPFPDLDHFLHLMNPQATPSSLTPQLNDRLQLLAHGSLRPAEAEALCREISGHREALAVLADLLKAEERGKNETW